MVVKYQDNTRIGPNHILLKERKYKKGSRWYGIFICPYCEKEFTTAIQYVADGQTKSCGCLGGYKDLRGLSFGKLTVMEKTNRRQNGHIIWKCRCECGNITYVSTHHLKDGTVKSCGCLNTVDLTNRRFGKLIALYPTDERQHGNVVWQCICDCGQLKKYSTSSLLSGDAISCGCLSSKGELRIKEVLEHYHINYIREKVFDNCINPETQAKLRFDFYLPDYDCCIEYNGEQHYTYHKTGWNTKDSYQRLQKRDSIKKQFCQDSGKNILIIPYWEYANIENILLFNILRDKAERGGEV